MQFIKIKPERNRTLHRFLFFENRKLETCSMKINGQTGTLGQDLFTGKFKQIILIFHRCHQNIEKEGTLLTYCMKLQ